jgi:hypothetical protein
MPTASDLVTDLPADFEVFGQAVATSMADLLGGTTGQILSKASNTNMDFTWITNDVGDITAVTAGTGISGGGTSGAVTVTNSMATTIDAKGDLVPGTGADTFARLAVGTDNSLLTAASGEATGLKYAGLWTTFTPTIAGVTLGYGSKSGSYCQIADTVFFRVIMVLGSTTSITAEIDLTLPTTASGYSTLDFMNVASQVYDTSASAWYSSTANLAVGNTVRAGVLNTSGTYGSFAQFGNGVPISFASGDSISWQGLYRTS